MYALIFWAVASVLFTTGLSAEEKNDQKNVILFVVDDMGFQAGCFGNKVIKTPNIDRLAASGTRFSEAYCTTASCSASRSVLMTGLYNHATGHYGHAHGYNHFSTYESVRSLPVLLAEAGYRTCSIGKYHLAPEYIYHFEDYRNQGTQGHRNSIRMALNAKEWITEKDDRPFFLYFCSSDPHRGAKPDGFSNFNDNPHHYKGVKQVKYSPEEVVVPTWLPDTPESRAELAEFYQAISRLDQGLGLLLDTLEETGHADDTLILFLSDNGPPFPGAKTNHYEPGSNLPLIVRNPHIKQQNLTTNAKVTWADITPTILDYCGVKPGPGVPVRARENQGKPQTQARKKVPFKTHGRSFLSVVDQPDPEGWDEVFLSHTFHEITMYYPMKTVISGDYKLTFNIAHDLPYPFASDLYACPTWQATLRNKPELYGKRTVYNYLHRPEFELYNLKTDPDELQNLAYDAKHQQVFESLAAKLKQWQIDTNDPWKLKWEYE